MFRVGSGGAASSGGRWWPLERSLRSFPPRTFCDLSSHHLSLFPNQFAILCAANYSLIAVIHPAPKGCSLKTSPLSPLSSPLSCGWEKAQESRKCRMAGAELHKPWSPSSLFQGGKGHWCLWGRSELQLRLLWLCFAQQLLMGLSLPMAGTRLSTFTGVKGEMSSVTGDWWGLYSSPFFMAFAKCWSRIKMSLSNGMALKKKGAAEFPAGRSILGSLGTFSKNLLE